jgi:hypothetical protein
MKGGISAVKEYSGASIPLAIDYDLPASAFPVHHANKGKQL